MTHPIDFLNIATTAVVGASIMAVMRPNSTGKTVLTVALFVLAAVAIVQSFTADGGGE